MACGHDADHRFARYARGAEEDEMRLHTWVVDFGGRCVYC
jgi:hypothetical protein